MNTSPVSSVLLLACVWLFCPAGLLGQGTPSHLSSFTYQGSLNDAGSPAAGPYDFEFRLFDAENGDGQIGTALVRDDVTVSGGDFSVILDFGAAAFDGSPRWLEIAVRPGAQTGAFTTLTPRQPVTVTPHAMWSARAATLEGVPSSGFWRAGGNAGTLPETDFLGTTDTAPLVFRANNLQVLKLEAAESGARTVFGASNTVDASSNNSSILGGLTNSIGASAHESTIAAGQQNVVGATQRGAVIGGGARNQIGVDNQYALIAGGRDNRIGGNSRVSIVVGGRDNRIGDNVDGGLIVGGFRNDILGSTNPAARQIAPLILGGSDNEIGRHDGGVSPNVGWGTILGGDANRIGQNSGFAVIAGGLNNLVADNSPFTFAAGRRARVNHSGAFVWADGQNASFASAGVNTFNIRAEGGIHVNGDTSQFFGSSVRQMLNLWSDRYGIGVQSGTLYFRTDAAGGFSWHRGGTHSNTANHPGSGGVEMMRLNSTGLRVNGTFVSASDREMKERFQTVDPVAVLEKVAALPVSEWSYREDPEARHIGPMAQDFHAAFGVGPDDRHIATVDADGVALAAIQGLNQKLMAELERKHAELTDLRDRLERLERLLGAQHSR